MLLTTTAQDEIQSCPLLATNSEIKSQDQVSPATYGNQESGTEK
jgi:hypothetical protein